MDDDVEKQSRKDSGSTDPENTSDDNLEHTVTSGSKLQDFRDSFKRKEVDNSLPSGDSPTPEQLNRRLKGRHLQMIAIGGSIGTGLFVGSGSTLAGGGPASLVIAFGLIGIMLYCTVHALGEMAVVYPVAGSFATYSTRFLDPAWGFAMGWNYALQWLVTLPLEIIAASITMSFWPTTRDTNGAAWVSIFLVVIIIINLFGVRGYGEAEFAFSIVKIIAVIGFIILGICIDCGASPSGEHIGTRYWNNPGAFHNGFKGLCSVFVTAAFAFGGTEMVGLAAAETKNPRQTLPSAVKQVFWRICLFYMVSLTIVGLLVPYTNDQLLNGNGSSDANALPFAIAIRSAGINGLPSVFNVVIMIAVLSVGNSSIYTSSRTLAALANNGQAPKILGYVDRAGRPIVAIGLASMIGLFCFLVAAGSNTRQQAFNWILALSGLSSIFTWGSVCLAHIHFRRAWKVQGHSLDELAYRSQPGVIGSWIGFILNCLVLIAQFWTGFAPTGYGDMTAGARVQNFFEKYLSALIVIVFFISFKLIKKTKIRKAHEIDLVTGHRDINLAELIAEEKAEKARWPVWKRVYIFFC